MFIMFSEVNSFKVNVTVMRKFDSALFLASSISFNLSVSSRASSLELSLKIETAFKI